MCCSSQRAQSKSSLRSLPVPLDVLFVCVLADVCMHGLFFFLPKKSGSGPLLALPGLQCGISNIVFILGRLDDRVPERAALARRSLLIRLAFFPFYPPPFLLLSCTFNFLAAGICLMVLGWHSREAPVQERVAFLRAASTKFEDALEAEPGNQLALRYSGSLSFFSLMFLFASCFLCLPLLLLL